MSDILLDPGAGGRSILGSALQPADIIVSTTSANVSKVIRGGTGSEISHAALYIGDGEIIEAIGEGVVRRALDVALHDDTLAVAYRAKTITPEQAKSVIGYAMPWIGKKYDYTGAAGGGAKANLALCIIVLGPVGCVIARNSGLKSKDRFYCSQLVLEAYQRAGLPLINSSPDTSNPNNIVEAFSNGTLVYVGHLRD